MVIRPWSPPPERVRWWRRLRQPPVWVVAAVAGGGSVAVGALSWSAALATLTRVARFSGSWWPDGVGRALRRRAGMFDVTADRAARVAGGRTWLLFGLVVVLATGCTVLLGLDTTAVLLTPVVLSICARLGLPPLPFAMATVWPANTASLLLPVSNLTNLLALGSLDLGTSGFAARMARPPLAAVLITVVVLPGLHRRQLRGRFGSPWNATP